MLHIGETKLSVKTANAMRNLTKKPVNSVHTINQSVHTQLQDCGSLRINFEL